MIFDLAPGFMSVAPGDRRIIVGSFDVAYVRHDRKTHRVVRWKLFTCPSESR